MPLALIDIDTLQPRSALAVICRPPHALTNIDTLQSRYALATIYRPPHVLTDIDTLQPRYALATICRQPPALTYIDTLQPRCALAAIYRLPRVWRDMYKLAGTNLHGHFICAVVCSQALGSCALLSRGEPRTPPPAVRHPVAGLCPSPGPPPRWGQSAPRPQPSLRPAGSLPATPDLEHCYRHAPRAYSHCPPRAGPARPLRLRPNVTFYALVVRPCISNQQRSH